MNRIGMNLQALLLLTECVVMTRSCSTDWFGPKCQYKCHCEGRRCSKTGECQNARCERGWFEYLCQYQNLLALPKTSLVADPSFSSLDWLTDNSDSTCCSRPASSSNKVPLITITFELPQIFTWLQITVKYAGAVDKIAVQFQKGNGTQKTDCYDRDSFALTSSRFEIRCNVTQPFTIIILSGVGIYDLCALDINGGRNVALRQETTQFGMFKAGFPTSSDRAVDGDTSPVITDGSCARGADRSESPPTWAVKYPYDFCITRFLLYNRNKHAHRLLHFSLDAYDAHNGSVFRYKDPRTDAIPVYDVLNLNWKNPLRLVVITQNLTVHHSLTVCEVETFGECPPKTTNLYCENCYDRCLLGSCFRNGSCRAGCNGYTNPPFCTLGCRLGQWGPSCSYRCKHCASRKCNSTTGQCLGSCDGFRNPPICTEECGQGAWGVNCLNTCRNCVNGACDPQTGLCEEGCNGFTNPPKCDRACRRGKWGPTCSSNCKHCANKTCAGTMYGDCMHGCNGYKNPPKCDIECEIGTWGVHCAENCSRKCSRLLCNTYTGTCTYGCTPGYGSPDCTIAAKGYVVEYGNHLLFMITVIVLVASVLAFLVVRSKREEQEKEYLVIEPPMSIRELNVFMQEHDFNFFFQIFESVPEVEVIPESAGLHVNSAMKNTDPTIYAYDHNRVILRLFKDTRITGTPGQRDYINASFIKGFSPVNRFIATQGPTETTIVDFVGMVWEQQVDVIAMLTKSRENNEVMSEDYWSGKQQFDKVHVELISEEIFANFTIRRLELSKKGVESHEITQYQYTAWPETGVPELPWSFVDFQQTVCAHVTDRPVVVHCRYGADRTGVFIALHNVLEEAEATGEVDFFQTLVTLRMQRLSMIETAEQYWFLHKAVQLGVMCIGKTLTATNICNRMNSLQDVQLREEYKAVCLMSEEFRVKSDVRHQSSITNDITHVSIEGSKRGNKRILASLPKPDQVFAFWTMVCQNNVSGIVCLDVNLEGHEVVFHYLPTGDAKSLNCEPYRIRSTVVTQTEIWEERKLTAQLASNYKHSVVTNLKANFNILDAVHCLAFIQKARTIKVSPDETIMYTCRNGAVKSGLAFVLSVLLDKLDGGYSITVPLVVGSVKAVKPEAIPTLEQYILLYHVLKASLPML